MFSVIEFLIVSLIEFLIVSLIELLIAEDDLIALNTLLEYHLLHLLLSITELHLSHILYVKKEVFLESLDSQVLLVARCDPSLFVDLKIKQIHPLDPLELILHQHLIENGFALI